MEIGASFSHYFLKYLGLDIFDAIKEYKTLGMQWVRLGCYWSSIESVKKTYDFTEMDRIVESFEGSGLKIIMTVGMKSPRWPEYFIPSWLVKETKYPKNKIVDQNDVAVSSNVLGFISQCVKRYTNKRAIKVWQIENEPLDPAGEFGMSISEDLLKNEIAQVRRDDNIRKTLVSVWGNELIKRGNYQIAADLADIVGINLYLRHPVKRLGLFNGYSGPKDRLERIKRVLSNIKRQGKTVWITELQSEPWETDGVVTRKTNPPSFLPGDFESNLKYGVGLGASVILLWGYEWWYLKRVRGDGRYWEEAKRIIDQYMRGE